MKGATKSLPGVVAIYFLIRKGKTIKINQKKFLGEKRFSKIRLWVPTRLLLLPPRLGYRGAKQAGRASGGARGLAAAPTYVRRGRGADWVLF